MHSLWHGEDRGPGEDGLRLILIELIVIAILTLLGLQIADLASQITRGWGRP
jgi:hypothetical protein